MAQLQNKRIVITGASGGLGAGVVTTLLDSGASVHAPMVESAAVTDAPYNRVQQVAGVSLLDESQTKEYFASVGPIDGAALLVGGFSMAPLLDTPLADVEKMFRLNVCTAFLCLREAAKVMPNGGRIVLVSARVVEAPAPGMIAYSLSKAAVTQLVRSAAVELLDKNIQVNGIMPSIIDTPTNREAMPDAPHDAWPKPQELGQLISFLLSEDNALTSGALVPAYGSQ